MGIYGNRWGPLNPKEVDGNPQNFMESMKINGNPRKSKEIHGHQWDPWNAWTHGQPTNLIKKSVLKNRLWEKTVLENGFW